MKTSNPAINKNTFLNLEHVSSSEAMTVNGTINKTFISLLLVFLSAMFVWNEFYATGFTPLLTGILIGGSIGGFVLFLVTMFKKQWASYTTPLYAITEGAVLGLLSAFFEVSFPGIVMQAVALTFGTFFVMLYLFRSRIIKVTNKLRMILGAAIGAIFLVYLVSFVLSFFGTTIPLIHEGGTIGIVFSLIVIGVAAFSLLLDFDFIEQGAKRNAPKYMEWFATFGLLVTLVWLYIEILRLLSKIRNN